MPHIVVEYSANLRDALDLDSLLGRLHDAALETGVFPIGGLRTRAAERRDYRIADGDPANGFVHVLLKIGHGRDLDTRKRAAGHVFDALCGHLGPLFERTPLGISLEVQEIDPDLNFKKNNLHEHVAARRGAASVA